MTIITRAIISQLAFEKLKEFNYKVIVGKYIKLFSVSFSFDTPLRIIWLDWNASNNIATSKLDFFKLDHRKWINSYTIATANVLSESVDRSTSCEWNENLIANVAKMAF